MKNVIITGTSRGIGLELVKYFSEAGHRVLALSRNNKPVEVLRINNVHSFSFDINREEDIAQVSGFIEKNWEYADILINNAGAMLNKPFSEITTREFENIYKTNVFGVAALTREVMPFLKEPAHVLTVSSMGGIQGSMKFPGLAAYSSSKGAVITLMELLAEEYKNSGISFNVMALGAVQTEMLGEAFPGYEAPVTPVQMAEHIAEFALTGNKFYNGKILQVSNSTP